MRDELFETATTPTDGLALMCHNQILHTMEATEHEPCDVAQLEHPGLAKSLGWW